MGIVCANAKSRSLLNLYYKNMINYTHEYFEEFEIEYDFRTYYASGYIEYRTTACVGSNYEEHDYEILYESELNDITITDLWYFDEETGDAVEILNQYNYIEIEQIAEEQIRYKYE